MLAFLALLFTAPLANAAEAKLTCPEVFEGPAQPGGANLVGAPVTIRIEPNAKEMLSAVVEGITKGYPTGTKLRMNYQNALGRGPEKGGEVFYTEPGDGDGLLQLLCGEDANVVIHNTDHDETYCGRCQPSLE
ncbi:MAG: hypothetical protein EOP11_10200 [Proteobacteria bacterium]|nr:MAG: hypothetical protein EOP11_10200 [Pseudomonadota bacterium]